MTETELEYQFCFNCNDRKNCYTKPKDCTRIKEEIGLQDMTNEEWLKSMNTEQLAEWFGDWHSFSCVFCKHWKNGCIYNHNQVRCAIEEGKSNKELWVEWLKQPHTFE